MGAARQAIRDLPWAARDRTQQELAGPREQGFRTTQATISRDVGELGLIKVSREGTQAYALPPRLIEAETSGEDRLRKLWGPAGRDPRGGPAARHADAAWFGPRDRRGARPGALAGGGRLDRRRRHALRRLPGPWLAPAHPLGAFFASRNSRMTARLTFRGGRLGYCAVRTSGRRARVGNLGSFSWPGPRRTPSSSQIGRPQPTDLPITTPTEQALPAVNKPTYLSRKASRSSSRSSRR